MNPRLRYRNLRSRRNRRSGQTRSLTTAQESQNYYANFFQAANVPFATFESLEQLTIPLVSVPNEIIWLRSILVPVLDVEPMEFERCRGGRGGGRARCEYIKPFEDVGQPMTSVVIKEEPQIEASPGPSQVRVNSEPRDQPKDYFREFTWADIFCWSYSEEEEALEPEERAKRKEKQKLRLEREAAELRREHQIAQRRLQVDNQKGKQISREEQRQRSVKTPNFKPRYKFDSDKKDELTSSLTFPVSTNLTVAEYCESETRLEYLEGDENDDLTPESSPIHEMNYETGEVNPIDDDQDILVIGLTRAEMEEF